jgi:crotonobetainyl-CoA:carnitine CoA-transferase CaiB-like acyl-CoA transferase
MTGTTAALGLVSAVLGARASGEGRDVDVSLFDVAMHNLAYVATWYLNGAHETGRAPRSGHPSLVPSQLYPTSDGWIFIMCNKEKFWGVLCEAIGKPEWADHPDYRSFASRLQNRHALNQALDGVLQTATTAEWLTRFAGRVPASPVHDVAQALDSEFAAESGAVVTVEHPSGPIRTLACPVRAGAQATRPAPAMGADTDAVLRRAGYDPGQIRVLRDHAVI